ncbi:unnamed protein product, partial [Medioppia subpectinata]
MNLIYDKSDTFDITLDGKYANSTADNELNNTCQLLADHQSSGYIPSVFYKFCDQINRQSDNSVLISLSTSLVGVGSGGVGI